MGTFGETLRKEREKRGITLENVSEGTKIGTRFLRALESEQFDQLPGGVFNKGFVRAYAKHIGLDETKTIEDFLAASGQSAPALPEISTNHTGKNDRNKNDKNNNDKDSEEKPAKPRAEPIRIVETQPEDPEQADYAEILRRLPWREAGTFVLIVAVLFFGWRYISHRRHASTVAARSESAAKSPSSSTATNSTALNSPAPNTPAQPAPSAIQLVIRADEDSWLSVITDGANQGELMLLAGESKTLQADREIIVKAGNAGGLAFLLNGSKLPAQGDEGEVVTLNFDRNGVKKVPPQPAPVDQP